MKIILANGTELTPINASAGKRTVQGSNRDTLFFTFPADAGLESLDAVFTEANCANITVEDDDGNSFVHSGYVIRAELNKKPVQVEVETADAAAVYEDRITVAMAQRTYMETQLAALLNRG